MTTEARSLLLDDPTIREIVKEIAMKFELHTDNISFHLDAHSISIHVFPNHAGQFKLPDGPRDVRLRGSDMFLSRPPDVL